MFFRIGLGSFGGGLIAISSIANERTGSTVLPDGLLDGRSLLTL